MSDTEKIGLLTVLLENHSKAAAALSDRQLGVAVSVVTFQLALVAGLSIRPITMSPPFAALGVSILVAFDLVACHYIASKARLYWLHQDRRNEVESMLLHLTGLGSTTEMPAELSRPIEPDTRTSYMKALVRGGRGSLYFIGCMLLSGLLAVYAVYHAAAQQGAATL